MKNRHSTECKLHPDLGLLNAHCEHLGDDWIAHMEGHFVECNAYHIGPASDTYLFPKGDLEADVNWDYLQACLLRHEPPIHREYESIKYVGEFTRLNFERTP